MSVDLSIRLASSMNVAIPTLRNGGKLSKNHCPAGFRLMWLGDKVTPVHISSAKMTLSVSCLILPRSFGLTGRVDGHIERTFAIFVLAIKQYKSARQLGAVKQDGCCSQSCCRASTMCLFVELVRASTCADPESTIGQHRLATRFQD